MKPRIDLDVSHLPNYGFRTASTPWWGTLGFCALEGMGFALAIGTYLYLAYVGPAWSAAAEPPDHLAGTLMTLLLLASLGPNILIEKAAKAHDLRRVRRLLLAVSVIGIVAVGIRLWEFDSLNIRWDANAYGSILWVLLGLHLAHLATDLGDTLVLTVLMFTRHGHGRRFSDVDDNAFYWYFVIIAWLPLYGLIYWGPRL